MALDAKLLDILCCPVSKTPLVRLEKNRLQKLNQLIADGQVLYVDGSPVNHALQEALITEDNKVIYEVDDNIPIMLEEKGIGSTQFSDF